MKEVTLSVRARSSKSVRTQVETKNHTWHIDEPEPFGGEDSAPSPVDMLLGSLAGCISAIGHLVAKEMGFCLESLEIYIDGDINPKRFLGTCMDGRSGFSKIAVRIEVVADWTPGQRDDWLRQVELRCPVIDNLAAPCALDICLI